MSQALWVALGGALGSVARWALTGLVQGAAGGFFPWGTFAVNAIGSLAIGLLAASSLAGAPSGSMRLFLVTGVLGGFTTFSAFSGETVALIRAGQAWPALAYVAASVLGGVAFAFAGLAIGQRM